MFSSMWNYWHPKVYYSRQTLFPSYNLLMSGLVSICSLTTSIAWDVNPGFSLSSLYALFANSEDNPQPNSAILMWYSFYQQIIEYVSDKIVLHRIIVSIWKSGNMIYIYNLTFIAGWWGRYKDLLTCEQFLCWYIHSPIDHILLNISSSYFYEVNMRQYLGVELLHYMLTVSNHVFSALLTLVIVSRICTFLYIIDAQSVKDNINYYLITKTVHLQ